MKIIFKHSYLCPLSRRAKNEIDAFLKNNTRELEYELVDVVGNQERSDMIAEQYGIRHESPQLIILDDNDKVLWHASHRMIKEESIIEALL